MLVIASETNAPVSHSEPILGRRDIDQTHHVALPGPREMLYRVNYTTLRRPVEPLQIS